MLLLELGNKGVVWLNGMKFITAGDVEESPHEVPDFPFLKSMAIDGLAHLADTVSKENWDGMTNTAQMQMTFFGIDLVPAYAQSLFGIDRAAWDGMTDTEQLSVRQQVRNLFSQFAGTGELTTATTLSLMDQLANPDAALENMLQTLALKEPLIASGADLTVLSKPVQSQTPEDQVTLAALTFLQWQGAEVMDVMGAPGLDAPRVGTNAQTFTPPELFTLIFDAAPIGSPLSVWFNRQINERLNNAPGQATGEGYHISEDGVFTVFNKKGEKTLSGYLQLAGLYSSGHNSELKQQSRERNVGTREAASEQQTLLVSQSLGAQMSRAKGLRKTEAFLKREGIVDVETGRDVLGLLNNETLRSIPTGTLARQLTASERLALRVNRDARIQFQREVDTSGWTPEERSQWTTLRNSIVLDMGLTEDHAFRVDGWVRSWLGRPAAAKDQPAEVGHFSFAEAKDAIQHGIRPMMEDGRLPIDLAPQNQMGLDDILALAEGARNGARWKLRDANGEQAQGLDDFVMAALSARDRLAPEQLFQNAADGFMNTFRDLGDVYTDLPVSFDDLKMTRLFDPQTQEMVLSLDPSRASRVSAEEFGGVGAVLADVFGGRISGGEWAGDYPPASSVSEGMKRRAAYRKKHGIPDAVPMTLEQMRASGMRFVTHGTETSALLRILTNVRAANGMFNPWLFATQPVETFIKNSLESTKNLLTGEGSGAFSQALAAKLQGADAAAYSKALMQQKNAVAASLGQHQAFKGMINQELVVHPKFSNAGKFEKFTANLASLGGRWQDPSYGMRQEKMAQRYLDAVMRNAVYQTSSMSLTPQQLLDRLKTDPTYIRDNYPELHQFGINVIANIRSLKPTMPSLLLMKGLIDPLTTNPHLGVNYASTLMLKLPFMFFNYASNTATNMLGLQGVNALVALAMSAPKVQNAFGRLRAAAAGRLSEYKGNERDFNIDYLSETLESVNLADAFIQSGLTHTGLMGIGLLTGSLGLAGEDDEDRRRRRAAQEQGAGYVYDPREIQNDWRNADAMYLDNLPDWFPFADAIRQMYKVSVDQDGDAVSMVELHWTLKQFISPFMGISEFINTGNFQHVIWGFQDALGSMPLVNETSYDEAVRVAMELQNAAADIESRGNPQELPEAFNLMLGATMTLERMLLENAFVNSIYTSTDKYDRDPYTLADLDDTGNIQRDDTGQPQETTALQQYKDELTGEIKEGYLKPDLTQTKLKSLTEARGTLAFLLSLTDGLGESDYLRTNMAVKTRTINQEGLTDDEAMSVVMSMWDPNEKREVLTDEGGLAVIKGLQMGTVKPGSPVLDGLYMDYEQRNRLYERITTQLAQEYTDLGMSPEKVKEQVRYTMFGSPYNPGSVPLWEVIFSKGPTFEDAISYNPKLEYRQFNTTYTPGPDGSWWATGVARSSLENPFGQAPLQTYNTGQLGGNLGVDERLNSTDEFANLNTGRRNLERVDESVMNITDDELLAKLQESIGQLIDAVNYPKGDSDNNGGGYGRYYGGRGGYGRGGGGGGGGGGYAYRVNAPVRNDPTYGRNVPYINSDNPIIRRASIRRERFSSTRGRLNQWQ